MENSNKIKWYNKKGLVLFLTIIVWPIGLFGLYLSKTLSKKFKITWVIFIIILAGIFNAIISSISNENLVTESTITNDNRPLEQIQFEDKAWSFVKAFSEAELNEND